jgi:hypothetical protein
VQVVGGLVGDDHPLAIGRGDRGLRLVPTSSDFAMRPEATSMMVSEDSFSFTT